MSRPRWEENVPVVIMGIKKKKILKKYISKINTSTS